MGSLGIDVRARAGASPAQDTSLLGAALPADLRLAMPESPADKDMVDAGLDMLEELGAPAVEASPQFGLSEIKQAPLMQSMMEKLARVDEARELNRQIFGEKTFDLQ